MLDETRPHKPVKDSDVENALEKTRPHRVVQPGSRPPLRKWKLALIPGFALLVVLLAALAGNVVGNAERTSQQEVSVAESIDEQFNRSVEEFLEGDFLLAEQRLEYILSIDPENADAAELLGMVLAAMNQPTPTASPAVSPTPTVTPNTGSLEETFSSAQIAFANGDWTGTINLLVLLRGRDPDYRRSEANQILASALRNRGMDKLFQGYLEQGIYDLNLSERFGPLDAQAASWRQSAAFYVFANSYIGLDWALAAEYMGQMCQANIWGACAKFANAAREYANLLMEDENWCDGSAYYAQALASGFDTSFAPTATEAAVRCLTATAPTPTTTITPTGSATLLMTLTPSTTFTPDLTTTATITPTPTATATSGGPTNTPGVTPTPTATPSPTSTPTPTDTIPVPTATE